MKREKASMTTESSLLAWAEEQARSLLSPLGDRWLHTKGVVERAQAVGKAFNEEDRVILIAAAYLHDIGHTPSLHRTDFHPLDGAHYLLAHNQRRLASLVAYHSEAQYEAQLRGLTTELEKIPQEHSALADAVTYCDMTTAPTGSPISFKERLTDIFQRYDETHIVNQAMHQAIRSLALSIKRTQDRLDLCRPSIL
jgi:HD superfamily phosphohydrolase